MKKLALASLVLGIAVFAWRARRSDADAKLVFDRFWVDHAPKNYRDQFQALMISGEVPVGNFSTRTPWNGQWEGFHYHVVPREDGTLDLIFPASEQHERVQYTARRCSENGFDFCLDVSGASRGAKRYYSKKGWELDGATPAMPRELLID